jgi:sensor histidine kinase YesM
VKPIPIRQLIKIAFITAPLIAVTYCTPFYIFKVIPNISYFAIWPLFTLPVLMCWLLNILFLVLIKKEWARTFIRTIIICIIMFGVSGIITLIVKPLVHIEDSYITLMRVVNIVSVNAIVYIIIDLVMTKENKNLVDLENANLRINTLEAEYKLLKDQVNPHFLFNALSTAKALIKPEPQLAEEYIVRLSDFLRASINIDRKTVSVKDEIQLCKDFVSLNQIRFGNALQVTYELPPTTGSIYVPYFSLVSLLENCLKHNSLTIDSPLIIKISLEEGMIEVKNNRNPKFIIEPPSKTGISNLRERYKLVSGKDIHIIETEKEFRVQIPVLMQ